MQQSPAARYAALRDKLNQNTVTVISGNPNGTYLYLAYDMSAVLDDGNELRVLPVIGKGGYQNVMDVLHLRGVDLCITQSNIMTYLKKTGEMGPNIENRLAFITRLYNEEMHVLAGAGINSIKDLDGKKVNFSDVGSGTQFSTRLILELLGIRATEVNVGQARRLPDGQVGRDRRHHSDRRQADRLLRQVQARARHEALAGTLRRGARAGLPACQAHESRIILISSHKATAWTLSPLRRCWPPTTGRATRIAIVGWPRSSMRSSPSSVEFQKPARHAKWKEANINSALKGWKRFPAAEEWLARNADKRVTQRRDRSWRRSRTGSQGRAQ